MQRPDPYVREYADSGIKYYYRKEFMDESRGEEFELLEGPKNNDETLAYKIDIEEKIITVSLSETYPVKTYDILNKKSLSGFYGIYRKTGSFVRGFGTFLGQILNDIEGLKYFAIDCHKNSKSRITGRKNIKLFLSLEDYNHFRDLHSYITNTHKVNSKYEGESRLNEILNKKIFAIDSSFTPIMSKRTLQTFVYRYLENIDKRELFNIMFNLYDKANELGLVNELVFKKFDSYRLNWIIEEYKKNLRNYPSDEIKWQKFFEDTFTTIYPNYKYIIREIDTIFNFKDTEANSRPVDFIAVDMYNNIELIELKTPSVKLMSSITNRNNYYLKSDCTKACTQLEKYLMRLEYNSNEMYKLIRKKISKKYGITQKCIELSIIRPKAKLIIGQVKSIIENENKYNDFQMQRQSFKNIELITYDEIYNGLVELKNELNKKAF